MVGGRTPLVSFLIILGGGPGIWSGFLTSAPLSPSQKEQIWGVGLPQSCPGRPTSWLLQQRDTR